MSDKEQDAKKYILILATGLVSLAVGVASALITNYLTRERLELTYSITSATFSDNSGQRVSIIAVSVTNSGRKEIESLQGSVDLEDAILTRFQHEGVLPTSISTKKTPSGITFGMPFLNSKETLAIQLLIEPQQDKLPPPKIEVRGKGVIGELQESGAIRDDKKSIPSVIVAPLFTVLAAFSMTLVLRGKRGSILSGGQQRDDFAYLLGLNGFLKEASFLRNTTRTHTYWALSDAFTERLIINQAKDTESLMRGVNVLAQTIEYAQGMASRSKAIILLNAARLAWVAMDADVSASFLDKARQAHAGEVEHRLQIDKLIKEIRPKPKQG